MTRMIAPPRRRTRLASFIRIFAVVAFGFAALAMPAKAQTFSEGQRGEIEAIIKNYLLTHPEILQEVSAELEKRQAAAESEKANAAIAKNGDAIFNSKHHVVLGNPKGDVNFVEFFDYNCGYCKRALDDMMILMKEDKNLRVVLKEFPVLGPGSVEAAQVAVAVRMQDKDGKLYLAFHQKLMGVRGQADRARAIAAAKEAGADVAKLEADMKSPEVKETLTESFTIAQSLGMNGTPSYVVGKSVVVGAVGLEGLRQKISEARCGKASC